MASTSDNTAKRTKGHYNSSLSLSHPFSKFRVSRTSLYRRAKRRREMEESQQLSAEGEEEVIDESRVSKRRHEMDSEVVDHEIELSSDFDRERQGEAISEYQVQGEPNVMSSCESNDCASDNLLESSSEIDEWVDSEGESEGLITGIDDTSDDFCIPLYDGAPLTKQASILLVQKFSFRHRLSQAASKDLLQLVKAHCPRPNVCCTSTYYLKKNVLPAVNAIQCKEYCTNCFNEATSSGNAACQNCNADIGRSRFIQISIEEQLKCLFKTERFTAALSHKPNEVVHHTTYCDLKDGECYKDIVRRGFFAESGTCNLTILMNTDGVPIFKSSGFSIWPILLQITELPFHLRIKPEFTITAGIWASVRKPDMSLLLRPFVESMNKLFTTGTEVLTSNQKSVVCKLCVIGCTVDLVARAPILNMSQFNGLYGCPKCLQKGRTVPVPEGRGHVHVYPHNERNADGPCRNSINYVQFGKQALQIRQPVFGVKGLSCLTDLSSFDIIKGMSVDYMHQAILGIGRQLLRLWFLSKNHNGEWYIGRRVKDIDSRLLCIRPPLEFQRLPRSINDTMKFWKAHEIKAWVLYYSLPVLNGILPQEYLDHHGYFVRGLSLLLKDSVEEIDIQAAHVSLLYYCGHFARLYGEHSMTINVHSLVNLCDNVRNLGPLWCNSCFPFENMNGVLKLMFHGSQRVDRQIANSIAVMNKLPVLLSQQTMEISPQYREVLNAMDGIESSRFERKIGDGITVCHKPYSVELSETEKQRIDSVFFSVDDPVMQYTRMQIGGRHIKILTQSLKTKRNDSCVHFLMRDKEDAFGLVYKILVNVHDDCVLLLYPLEKLSARSDLPSFVSKVPHIIPVKESSMLLQELVCVDAKCVVDKCLYLQLSNDDYFVCRFVNSIRES